MAAKKKKAVKKSVKKVAKKSPKMGLRVKSKSKPKIKPSSQSLGKAKSGQKAQPKGKRQGPPQSKPQAMAQKSLNIKWESFFTPLDDRIVVEVERFEMTTGGLYIPATAAEKPQTGKVLAVGRGHRDKKGKVRPMDVKTGDTIVFGPYSGAPLVMQNGELLILRESEVLGIVT